MGKNKLIEGRNGIFYAPTVKFLQKLFFFANEILIKIKEFSIFLIFWDFFLSKTSEIKFKISFLFFSYLGTPHWAHF